MKFGIYDKFKSLTTEYQYKQIQQFFQENQFSTESQAQSKAASLGLNISDVLSLTFGGNSASTNFAAWAQSLTQSSYQIAVQAGLQASDVQKISTALTGLVATCLTQKGLHAYIIPANDNQDFSVTLDFVPTSDTHPHTSGSFTITPSSVAATCSPQTLLGNSVNIGPQGVSVSCRRLPSDTVVVTANTADGSPTVTYDAYVVPLPTISFGANPLSIQAGQTSALSWDVSNASQVHIDGVPGQLTFSGSMTVSPPTTKDYRLVVVGLDGVTYSSFVHLTVQPPPPVLTNARIHFYTTDNDKDDDTYVAVSLICGSTTAAQSGGTYGHWDDNSDDGWIGMNVVDHPRKDQVSGVCRVHLVESPNGHDEWHFNWNLHLDYSDGTGQDFDLGAGNVDYDRNTIDHGI